MSIKETDTKRHPRLAAADIAKKALSFGDVQMDLQTAYWNEGRPGKKTQYFIVSRDKGGRLADETTEKYNVTSNVHGYGGGAFCVKDDVIYFFDAISSQVYKKDCNTNQYTALTRGSGFSYADFCVDAQHEYLYALRLEAGTNSQFPTTTIVRIHISSHCEGVIFKGADFYSNIRISSDGNKLLFLQWNYPNMPWDENELWVADIDKNFKITHLKKWFHKKGVSLYQPEWHISQKIYAATDENGYWNIAQVLENSCDILCESDRDCGRPLWIANTRTFGFISDTQMIVQGTDEGVWKTSLIDIQDKTQRFILNDLTCFQNMAANNHGVIFLGGNAQLPLSVLFAESNNLKNYEVLQKTLAFNLNPDHFSKPEIIEFNSHGKKVYAFYYPPINISQDLKSSINFPCILKIHGGPTACADYLFNPKVQYYTTRGYAYVEINYSGSSGYGKEYRNRLNGQWGIIDAEDCIACAEYLIDSRLASADKLFLSGSSAGGFTLLNVLTKSNLFKGAACHYGIADLAQMAQHIHKFEACYDQNLIGDTLQNNAELYTSRSPIHCAYKIKTPVIFFHGMSDSVVHYSQTVSMGDALKKNNVECEVLLFEGEGHGFKREETIVAVLEKEQEFFERG